MSASPSAVKKSCPRCGAVSTGPSQYCPGCGVALRAGGAGSAHDSPNGPRVLERLRETTRGEFDILDELGRGGMATVFLGHDLALERKVAIKVLAPEYAGRPDMSERFLREARTAARLSHPHIIPIIAVRQVDDLQFIVMKYVEGLGLDGLIALSGPLPIPLVHRLLTQVGGALDFAHERGIVHRDIKPANILVDEHGWAIVTDFGIAKVAEAQGLTVAGGTLGTPAYMSPEQCVGGDITGASDQYSLGLVAYQMLTGKLPFEADTTLSSMWAHVNETPRPVGEIRSETPQRLAAAIMRMLAKDPAERWPTLGAAMDAAADPRAPETGGADDGSTKSVAAPAPSRDVSPSAAEPEAVVVVTVSPPAGRVTVGGTLQLRAVPKGRSGAPLADRGVEWSSSAPGVASVSADGVVTGVEQGSVTITASSEGAVDVCTVRVDPRPVAAVRVIPNRLALRVTEAATLAVELKDATGQVVERPIQWVSSDAAIATVTPDGTVLGVKAGSCDVVGAIDGRRGTVSVTVNPIPLADLVLSTSEAVIGIGESLQLQAQPVDDRGMTLADRAVTWSSSDESVVRVSRRGLVEGRAEGTARVVARCEERTAVVSITARPVPLAALEVEPASGALVVGQRFRFTAEPQDASGRILVDRRVIWSSDDASVIDVSEDGTAIAVAAGSATVTGHCEDRTVGVAVTVTRVGVGSVEVESPARSLEVGAELRLRATTLDGFHQPLRGRFLEWQSSNPDIATVTQGGKVTGVSDGAVRITAACGNHSASVNLTVTPLKAARLKIVPARCSIPEGWQKQLTAVELSPSGDVISEVQCDWSVNDPSIASVTADGVVTTLRAGSTLIAASAGGKRATARIVVTIATT